MSINDNVHNMEGITDNDNGDKWMGKNDGCDAVVTTAKARAPLVMTPTEHLQNDPMLTQHLSEATGLLKKLRATGKQCTTK